MTRRCCSCCCMLHLLLVLQLLLIQKLLLLVQLLLLCVCGARWERQVVCMVQWLGCTRLRPEGLLLRRWQYLVVLICAAPSIINLESCLDDAMECHVNRY